jgi:hypothetical protein
MAEMEKTSQLSAHSDNDNAEAENSEHELYQQAIKAFIAKDYRRSWKLCLKFMATVKERPVWIEVYVLWLQAHLLPSNVDEFMDDALRICDEIERSFEFEEATEQAYIHLGELRKSCDGHKNCF